MTRAASILRVSVLSIAWTLPSICVNATQVERGLTCRYIVPGTKVSNPEIDHLLRSNAAGLYVCTGPDGSLKRYSALTKVWRRPPGLCEFRKSAPIYSEPLGRLPFPDQVYMATVDESECSQPDDEKYIPVTNVSEGLFAYIQTYFFEFSQSQLSTDAYLDPKHLNSDMKAKLKGVRTAISERGGKILSIALAPFFVDADTHGYAITIGTKSGERWLIYVDFDSGGLKVCGIEQLLN